MEIFNEGPFAVFESIYGNDYDEAGFKPNDKEVFKSVLNTLEKYGMPTNNYVRNLSTLSIKKTKKDKCDYLPIQNKIVCNDINNIKRELFCVASSNLEETIGISYRLKSGNILGHALTDGIIDFFTSLCDSNYKTKYPFEKMCAEILIFIYGIDILTYNFLNDPKEFLTKFKNPKIMIDFMDKLDKYQKNMKKIKREISNNEKISGSAITLVSFNFGECLNILAVLYHDNGNKDKEAFQRVIKNGLTEDVMLEVMNIINLNA